MDTVPELRWYAEGGVALDWTMTINGMRVVSDRMKSILASQAGPRDEIQWLPVTVTTTDGADHPYWIPHFPVWHDVLDRENTTFGPSGSPIKYVLSLSKLDGLNVFISFITTYPIIVRDHVREATGRLLSALLEVQAAVSRQASRRGTSLFGPTIHRVVHGCAEPRSKVSDFVRDRHVENPGVRAKLGDPRGQSARQHEQVSLPLALRVTQRKVEQGWAVLHRPSVPQ